MPTRYAPQDNPTIFGNILRGEIPCNKVYEDEHTLAFHDIAPKAPIHILIIPKQHITGIQHAAVGDEAWLGHLLVTASRVAELVGVQQAGYRLITNCGAGAGQEVPHLHFHLLANQPNAAETPTQKLPASKGRQRSSPTTPEIQSANRKDLASPYGGGKS